MEIQLPPLVIGMGLGFLFPGLFWNIILIPLEFILCLLEKGDDIAWKIKAARLFSKEDK